MSPLRAALWGLLYVFVSTLLIFVITFALILGWSTLLPFRADFGTNRVNWVVVGVALFPLFGLSWFLLIIFSVLLPFRFRTLLKRQTGLINPRNWLIPILAIESALCTLMPLSEPFALSAVGTLLALTIVAIANGPPLIVTAIATARFIRRLNEVLQRKQSRQHPAMVG
jgi:hypothetical protein